jgi:hypothetical protein
LKGAYNLDILKIISKKAATKKSSIWTGDGAHTSLAVVSGIGGFAVTADIVIGIAIRLTSSLLVSAIKARPAKKSRVKGGIEDSTCSLWHTIGTTF